ncbi:hypothetical protein CH300_00095 [Rhodococcus sp. 15-1154-1]|nr:hypothetical protein [Rhodococcus sp. 15-1154-1]OZF09816.1 hypothetical protein CH300_00095 [Rhodococcus sp. 15-1154-1]
MAKIKWSIHRKDSKIGKTEEVDDQLAQRYVDTGMATFVDEPETKSADTADTADTGPEVGEPVIDPASTDAGKADTAAQAGPNALSKPADGKAGAPAATAKPGSAK